jgi:hypothetical protein
MEDNGEWELPGKKGKQAMKEAAAAKAAEKERKEEIIKSLRDLIQGIYIDDNPVPEMQSLMITSIDGLRAMGENVSSYEGYGADRLARLARKKAAANQMAKNKAKVEKHFGINDGTRFSMRKRLMTTRWMGQTIIPSNANVYADLARDVNSKVQRKEEREKELERQRREEERRKATERQRWDSYFGRHSYSTGRPPRYNYDDYGSAAQGGPGQRAYAAPAMYPILGVPVNASEAEIKAAYREKAREGAHRHPNKGGNTAKFQALQAEYEKAMGAVGAEGGRRKTRKTSHRRSETRRNRS